MSAIKGVPQHIGGNESGGKYSLRSLTASETESLWKRMQDQIKKEAFVQCKVSILPDQCILYVKDEVDWTLARPIAARMTLLPLKKAFLV